MTKHLFLAALASTGMAYAEPSLGPGPFPIFNQAYQENYQADALPDILAQAQGAYVLLDPFGQDPQDWAKAIAALHAKGNSVGAYISIGTGEDWRADFAQLQPYLVSKPWDQWAGEYFVTSTNGATDIMKKRIDRIAALGFDWVEFDNMDWAEDDQSRRTYGFDVTKSQSQTYFQTLCAYVHLQGMRCMAKNTVNGANTFDGVLYESYSNQKNWWDEAGAKSFVQAGKPVIITHYDEADCPAARDFYRAIYGPTLSFICEDAALRRFVRFND